MKKYIIAVSLVALLPAIALAAQPDQCALNSTCSFSIRGKFNKVVKTAQLQAGQTYRCTVTQGKGSVISIKNIDASKGVSYELKGTRFNKAFIIRGPKKGVGVIQYTLYNHSYPWDNDNIQYKCQRVK